MTQLVPWTAAARRELAAGEPPLWNRGLGAGSPLLADQQTAIFHPFTLLGLALPIGKAWTLSAGLRLFWSLFFLYVFLRGWRLPLLASLFGAVAYGFCTFHVVWLLFPLGLATMMLPMGMAAAGELVRRPRWRSFLLLAGALALAVLGGHPESALFIGVTVGCYTLYLAMTEPMARAARARRLAAAAAAAAAAVALTAPAWYPTLAVLPLTGRFQAFESLSRQGQERRAGADWLLPLLAPNLLGTVPSGTYRPPQPRARWIPDDYGEVASGYAGIAALALTLALAFGRWRGKGGGSGGGGGESGSRAIGNRGPLRRPAAFFLGAMAVALLTVAEAPGWYPLFCRLPLLGVALHQRLRFLWALGAAVNGALALGALLEGRLAMLAVRRALAATAAVLALIAAARWQELGARGIRSFVLSQLAISMAVLAVLFLLAWAGGRDGAGATRDLSSHGALTRHLSSHGALARAWAIAAVALTFVELGALTWHYNPPGLPRELLPVTGAIRALQRTPAPGRIAAAGRSLLPDTPGYYGLEDVKTTDPVRDPRYLRLLAALLAVRPDDYDQRIHDMAAPFFDFLGVRAIYAPPGRPAPAAAMRLIYSGADGEVFANPRALPRYFLAGSWQVEPSFEGALAKLAAIADFRAATIVNRVPWQVRRAMSAGRDAAGGPRQPGDAAGLPRPPGYDVGSARGGKGAGGELRLLAYGANSARLAIDSHGWNLLVSSDADWPGWRLAWNGERLPAVVVNGAFVGAFVPPGRGVVELRNRPREVDMGLASAAGALLLLGLSYLVGRVWHDRGNAARQEV